MTQKTYQKTTDLPCWCGEGNSCCAYYAEPEPHFTCYRCEDEKTGKRKTLWPNNEKFKDFMEYLGMIPSKKEESPSEAIKTLQQTATTDRKFPLDNGIIAPLRDRGISKNVAEKYHVETFFDANNNPIARSYPGYSARGEFIAQKVKPLVPDKKMSWRGAHQDVTLFGQKFFSPGGRYITITEGEEDCMAVYQMLSEHTSVKDPCVVSIKDGAGGAERDIKNSYEFVNSFDNIIIAFDGDAPGRKAAEKVAKLFPMKAKILHFNDYYYDEDERKHKNKDANDYINRPQEFVTMWWNSEKYRPKGVLSFRSLWADMTTEENNIRVTYPWAGLTEKLHGVHTGDLVIIKAPPKIGKTSLLKELAYHVRSQTEENIGLIMLEDTKKSIGLGMCALHMNKPIQFPDIPFDIEELKEAHEYMSADDRIMIFDPEDDRTPDNIFNKIMFFVKAHNCRFIILDHISMLAYQADDNNERKFLDKLLADLKSLTTSLNIGIIAVIHVNDDGKTRGSRAPVQLCNALISLERDKLNPDPLIANTTQVIVEENRLTGDSGLACRLYFDRKTGRLTELDGDTLQELEDKIAEQNHDGMFDT